MIRTLADALTLVDAHSLVTEVPVPGATSLVEAVLGHAPRGSWREHPKGRLAYRLGRQLRASPDVLAVRLVAGKVAFVHPRLWPEVYRVAMEPARRRAALAGLSPPARALLERVEREGEVRLPKEGESAKARETLEERLLVHASEAPHPEGQGHEAVLRSWRAWAPALLRERAAHLAYDEALARLARVLGGEAHAGFGPWVQAGG